MRRSGISQLRSSRCFLGTVHHSHHSHGQSDFLSDGRRRRHPADGSVEQGDRSHHSMTSRYRRKKFLLPSMEDVMEDIRRGKSPVYYQNHPYYHTRRVSVHEGKEEALLAQQPGLDKLRFAAYLPQEGRKEDNYTNPWDEEEVDYDKEYNRLKGSQPVALGHVVAQLNERELAVDFSGTPLDCTFLLPDKYEVSPDSRVSLSKGKEKVDQVIFHEIGERVYVGYERNDTSAETPTNDANRASNYFLIGGIIIKFNHNDTYAVYLDNNSVDLAVPREKIVSTEERSSFLQRQEFKDILDWLLSAGVREVDSRVATAIILYRRGWRADRLYLLDINDTKIFSHLKKIDRVSIMEKAEWQRDHHRQMRSIYKERVKEKDKRYLFSKYAGILSASVAFVGASSLFGWNYKNYLKQTRDYQLSFAVDTLQRRAPPSATTKQGDAVVLRPKEERWIKKIIDRMDIHHPRVVVLTGYQGCGKSTLVRRVVSQESIPVVYVDVHSKEDTLRSVIKALGVPNVDACGEPSEFIADACTEARNRLGKTPLLVLKMREEDSLARVYNEAVTLACDRRVCHLILEVPLESLTIANTSLPRLDFYTVPAFSRKQAYAYTKHRFDALLLEQFMDIVGTNSNDLDELFAFMRQRSASPVEYINQKLLKSMRQLQSAWSQNPRAKEAVKRLSDFSYRDGQREGVDENSLRDPALQDIIIYNPVQDCWLFANKTLHTAARCCL